MIKVRLAILSHLSDAAIDMEFNEYMAKRRLGFVKQLIYLYPNTDVKVDEDYLEALWYNYNTNDDFVLG